MHDEHLKLLGEVGALEALLAKTPATNVIDTLSLNARLTSIRNKITQAASVREPARVKLTFRGKPVIGSKGIFVSFGTQAVAEFNDAIAAVAASITGELAGAGPIPNRSQNPLLITNTAHGSFGFELEEAKPADEDSPVATALEKTHALLYSTTQSDDILTETIAGTHSRVLDKVRIFLKTLVDNDAVCNFQTKDRSFKFDSVPEVQRSLDRMNANNISVVEETINGAFIGALPGRRSFEFRPVDGDGETIFGTATPDLMILDRINQNLGQVIAAKMLVTKVGTGKPRYQLIEEPDWNAIITAP